MKHQIQIITTILLLPILGISQNKFSFGINANAQLSFLDIKAYKSISGFEAKGGVGLGYSAGIQAQYDLSKKVFVRSGLNYLTRNLRQKIEGLRFETDILNGTESSIQNNASISSIGIPLDFGYRIQSKKEKINYLIGIGGQLNVNVDTYSEAKILHDLIPDEDLSTTQNKIEKSAYSVGIFGGVEIQLSDKFILGIEPNVCLTPNQFTLILFNSEARSAFETGLTIRIRMR
jgi:opacity protein-like surface antigen